MIIKEGRDNRNVRGDGFPSGLSEEEEERAIYGKGQYTLSSCLFGAGQNDSLRMNASRELRS